MDTWSDWEQIFQIFVSKMQGLEVSTLVSVEKQAPAVMNGEWNASRCASSDLQTKVWSFVLVMIKYKYTLYIYKDKVHPMT